MGNETFRITAMQAKPYSIGTDRSTFGADVSRDLAAHVGTKMLVYPELHLFHADEREDVPRNAALRASAIWLDDELIAQLAGIARDNNIWFIPGSIVERTDTDVIYNTTLVFSPAGDVVASYRKMFPWRPYEPYTPGTEFTVFDVPEVGRFGISICYDAWFPEVSRSLGWLGADVVINVVKTTTPDRGQELVLARANSIVNQTYTVSVNTAGPVGYGCSIACGPEGEVLAEIDGTKDGALVIDFDPAHLAKVRRVGTAGVNRMWEQFHDGDPIIPLPIYDGRIDPTTWKPIRFTN